MRNFVLEDDDITPKEGEFVKVTVPDSFFKRDYLLVLWPNINLEEVGKLNIGIFSIESNFIINLDGELSDSKTFGLDKNAKLMYPSGYDWFEIGMFLKQKGLKYNRKTKKIYSDESNR